MKAQLLANEMETLSLTQVRNLPVAIMATTRVCLMIRHDLRPTDILAKETNALPSSKEFAESDVKLVVD